jgi:hypothetical protein
MDKPLVKRVLGVTIMFLALTLYCQILLYTGSEETAAILQKTIVALLVGNRSSYSGTRISFDEEEEF